MVTKICSKTDCHLAGIEQDIFNFYFRKDTDGYHSICKNCIKVYQKNNQKHIKENRVEYRKNNKEKTKTYNASYYEENKEEIKKDRIDSYQENSHTLKLRSRTFYKNNKVKVLKNKLIYDLNKLKTDPIFKLRRKISAAIWRGLKRNGSSKNRKSILDFLEYSIEQLKIHLEKQFEPWMSWNNQGVYNIQIWNDNDQSTWTWNIDHIIPQSKLPYTTMESENFKKCWALENLRPYSAKQNIIDGAR